MIIEKPEIIIGQPKIFIAILSLNKFIATGIATRLVQWAGEGLQPILAFITGTSPVDFARNKAVEEFLKTDCTHILFWDHDIIPPKDALKKLYLHDLDIVSPMCPMVKIESGILSASFKKIDDDSGDYTTYMGTGLEEVDVCTGGMFLVKRHVFEGITRPFGMYYDEKGMRTHTEEFWFADKVREKGYKIYTDFDIRCEHLRQAPLLALTGEIVENA